MKSQKLKFVWNTALDNQRVFNFTRNPNWRIFLFFLKAYFSARWVLQFKKKVSQNWTKLQQNKTKQNINRTNKTNDHFFCQKTKYFLAQFYKLRSTHPNHQHVHLCIINKNWNLEIPTVRKKKDLFRKMVEKVKFWPKVTKIIFTPFSDCNILPFLKGFFLNHSNYNLFNCETWHPC